MVSDIQLDGFLLSKSLIQEALDTLGFAAESATRARVVAAEPQAPCGREPPLRRREKGLIRWALTTTMTTAVVGVRR